MRARFKEESMNQSGLRAGCSLRRVIWAGINMDRLCLLVVHIPLEHLHHINTASPNKTGLLHIGGLFPNSVNQRPPHPPPFLQTLGAILRPWRQVISPGHVMTMDRSCLSGPPLVFFFFPPQMTPQANSVSGMILEQSKLSSRQFWETSDQFWVTSAW